MLGTPFFFHRFAGQNIKRGIDSYRSCSIGCLTVIMQMVP